MKGFIITTLLFVILMTVISLNVFFISQTINTMKAEVSSLSRTPCLENEEIITNIINAWNKNSVWMSLSISNDDIEEVTDIIDSLKAANSTDNIIQFQINIELLLNSIEELGRLEKFSIKNIL